MSPEPIPPNAEALLGPDDSRCPAVCRLEQIGKRVRRNSDGPDGRVNAEFFLRHRPKLPAAIIEAC
jgi:hypothetical protein